MQRTRGTEAQDSAGPQPGDALPQAPGLPGIPWGGGQARSPQPSMRYSRMLSAALGVWDFWGLPFFLIKNN